MNDDLKRLSQMAQDYGHAPQSVKNDVFASITYMVLTELRTMSPAMINAAIATPWPAEMSAQDQIKAMHNAVIDAILKEL